MVDNPQQFVHHCEDELLVSRANLLIRNKSHSGNVNEHLGEVQGIGEEVLISLCNHIDLPTLDALLDGGDDGVSGPVVDSRGVVLAGNGEGILEGRAVQLALLYRKENEEVAVANELKGKVAVSGELRANLGGELTGKAVALCHLTAEGIAKEGVRAH